MAKGLCPNPGEHTGHLPATGRGCRARGTALPSNVDFPVSAPAAERASRISAALPSSLGDREGSESC